MSFQVPKARRKGRTLPRECHPVAHDRVTCKEPKKVSLKRASPYGSSVFDAYAGQTQYMGAFKASKRQRVYRATYQKKLDANVYPGEILRGRGGNDSFNQRLSGYNDLERAHLRNVVTGCTLPESLEQYDSDDDACSVGSCSVNGESNNEFSNFRVKLPCLHASMTCGDAESSCYSADMEENCSYCLEEKVEVSVHSLELHAYRCTMQALYVSGLLSWEQEELLTNLRIMLHISNDEHLTELRNQISSGTSK